VTAITIPTVTWTTDGGAYWTFRNNTSGYLSMTMSYGANTFTTTPPSIITIPPSNSVSLLLSYVSSPASSNFILM
jgi:hypothetical protein